jgi:hypothetical protein
MTPPSGSTSPTPHSLASITAASRGSASIRTQRAAKPAKRLACWTASTSRPRRADTITSRTTSAGSSSRVTVYPSPPRATTPAGWHAVSAHIAGSATGSLAVTPSRRSSSAGSVTAVTPTDRRRACSALSRTACALTRTPSRFTRSTETGSVGPVREPAKRNALVPCTMPRSISLSTTAPDQPAQPLSANAHRPWVNGPTRQRVIDRETLFHSSIHAGRCVDEGRLDSTPGNRGLTWPCRKAANALS